MKENRLRVFFLAIGVLVAVWFAGCQSTTLPSDNSNEEVAPAVVQEADSANTSDVSTVIPTRVHVRGFINRRIYSEGQVSLFIEGTPGNGSLYDRAWVLVTPITQIIGKDGQRISLSELYEGQQVAVVLRGLGQQLGTFAGRGVATRLWVE